ncbi:hypothetical protein Bbelb_425270 [Branchiostoma belcheri]|nr:hypothetical protein Bbelb_425270 [Branchiostoma belcheri]
MIVAARRAAGLRNHVYRAISGLLTYGLRRGPAGTYYIYDQDTYPSGEDVNWMLTNQDNRPTKEVGVEDLFEMFEILVFQIVIENTWAPLYKVNDFVVVPGVDGEGTVPWFAKVIATQPSARRLTVQWHVPNGEEEKIFARGDFNRGRAREIHHTISMAQYTHMQHNHYTAITHPTHPAFTAGHLD